MNRTIKDAAVKRFHYDDHSWLRRQLADFLDVYNFGHRLKALTPYEFICKQWTAEPERFRFNSLHQMPGLNTWWAILCINGINVPASLMITMSV